MPWLFTSDDQRHVFVQPFNELKRDSTFLQGHSGIHQVHMPQDGQLQAFQVLYLFHQRLDAVKPLYLQSLQEQVK